VRAAGSVFAGAGSARAALVADLVELEISVPGSDWSREAVAPARDGEAGVVVAAVDAWGPVIAGRLSAPDAAGSSASAWVGGWIGGGTGAMMAASADGGWIGVALSDGAAADGWS